MVGPVRNADPTIRHRETFALPTVLTAREVSDALEVEISPLPHEVVVLDVGCHMVVGAEVRFSWGNDPMVQLGGADFTASRTFRVPRDWPGFTSTRFRVQVTVFETDVPAQHDWDPRAGRFRILAIRNLELRR